MPNPTPPAIAPVTLTGRTVTLVPLTPDHRDGLAQAVTDGELWRLWVTAIPSPDEMAAEIDRRLDLQDRKTMIPFTIIAEPQGRLVGMTSYMNIDAVHRRVEIGSTWLAASVQRTGLNTEAKFLLLAHAFDTLACIAVEFRTHVLNRASRAAVERLGAKLDGVLRAHQRTPDGTLRDSAVYSITATEWPAIRAHLTALMQQRLARDHVAGRQTSATGHGG